MTSHVEQLIIQKAKKKEGYYICPIGCTTIRNPFTVTFENATIINLRETSSTLIIKCKKMSQYMDELNERIMDIVRENSGSWFNSTIDDELIEEYYISTLQYDKKRGETLRLKVKNIDEIETDIVQTSCSIELVLKYLKFYKQKFFPEFEVITLTPSSTQDALFCSDSEHDEKDSNFDDDDDEEVPKPTYEEVQTIKNDTLSKLTSKEKHIKCLIRDLEEKNIHILDAIQSLEKCVHLDSIIKLCDAYQNLICE